MRVWLFLVCVLFASPAWAGPWPRGQGHWFMATSSNWTQGPGGYGFFNTFYAEYGLTEQLTMVVDATLAHGQYSGVAYTRLPIWHSSRGHRLALEMGGGISGDQPLFRAGLSYGRGLETRWGTGWMTVDAVALVNTLTGRRSYKADMTLGLSPSNRWKMMMQVQTYMSEYGDYSATLAPSVVRRFGRSMWGELGVSHSLTGPGQTGLKLGVWIEF